MLNQALFGSSTIPALEQVVRFSQARHGVLAGNVANFDTPGYRVRDLAPEKFHARLKAALTQRDRGPSQAVSQAQLLPRDPMAEVSRDLEDVLFHDDSTGGLEEQIAQIAKNQMQHNLAMSIMASQFRLLQAAISERA